MGSEGIRGLGSVRYRRDQRNLRERSYGMLIGPQCSQWALRSVTGRRGSAEDDGDTATGLGTVDEGLLDVGRFRRTGDECSKSHLGHLYAGICLMHVVDNVITIDDYDEILGDKAYRALLHGLGNPDAGILRATYATLHYTNVSSVEILGSCYFIGISVRLHPRDIAGDGLRFRISLPDEIVDIVAFSHLDNFRSSSGCGCLDESLYRVGILQFREGEVRLVVGLAHVGA